MAELIDESFAELNSGKNKLSIKVQALNPGSFEVFLEVSPKDILNFFKVLEQFVEENPNLEKNSDPCETVQNLKETAG